MARKKNIVAYEKNPFLKHTSEVVKIGYKTVWVANDQNKAIINTLSGEMDQSNAAIMGVRRKVDRAEFVKLYAEGVGALLELKSSGKKIFHLIYEEISGGNSIGKDRVFLKYEALEPEIQAKIGKTTFYSGIKNCLENKIIAQSAQDNAIYYINPAFIFNGNRLLLLTDLRIDDEEN